MSNNQAFAIDELRTVLGKPPDELLDQIISTTKSFLLPREKPLSYQLPCQENIPKIQIITPYSIISSCVCKTMERLTNDCLLFLGSSTLTTEAQSRFQKTRSTTDHFVHFETFVRERFSNGERMVSIFVDLEKAYDTIWSYGTWKIFLYDMDLRRRFPFLYLKENL